MQGSTLFSRVDTAFSEGFLKETKDWKPEVEKGRERKREETS